MFFRQCHEQVTGADNDIDRVDPLHPVRQRGDSLGTTKAINLVDSKFKTDCQQVGVIGAKRRGRRNHDQLFHASGLGWNRSHQQ